MALDFDLNLLNTVKPRYEASGGPILDGDGPGRLTDLKCYEEQTKWGLAFIVEGTYNNDRQVKDTQFYPAPDAKKGAKEALISRVLGFFCGLVAPGTNNPMVTADSAKQWLVDYAKQNNVSSLDFVALWEALKAHKPEVCFYGYAADSEALDGDNYRYDEFIWIPGPHYELISQGNEKDTEGKTIVPQRQRRFLKQGSPAYFAVHGGAGMAGPTNGGTQPAPAPMNAQPAAPAAPAMPAMPAAPATPSVATPAAPVTPAAAPATPALPTGFLPTPG